MALPKGLPQISDVGRLLGQLDYNLVDETSSQLIATPTAGTPATGYFYSSISNRASIPDISKDLKVSFGIDRVAVQSIYEIQNEFGPNGERVWGAVGDDRGLIRVVGTPIIQNDAGGQYIQLTSGITDFVEIVFYGTGLNILRRIDGGADDIRYAIDGGSESSNIVATGANVIGSRNYSQNASQIAISVASGITLGVHTIRLRRVSGNFNLSGFEILNTNSTTNLKINPGYAYYNGDNIVSTIGSNSLLAKPTSITGGRGGRVITYLKLDGSFEQATRLVDPVPKGLGYSGTNLNGTWSGAQADHTNEEIARVYHWREFGAGRSDDFSILASTSGDKSFTLEDGTTTLSVKNGRSYSSTPEGINFGQSSTSDSCSFTFVGTGLDVQWVADGTSTAISVSIDGTNIGTIGPATTANIQKIQKIVSGLPYGTHIARFNTTSTVNNIAISKFITYQPKKPLISDKNIELADYNVLADYSLNTTIGTYGTISSGVIRKFSTREMTYYGTWNSVSQDINFLSGFAVSAQTATANVEYVFFGTGINLKMYLGNSAYNFTLSVGVNGAALSGNLSSYTSAFNYTGSGLTYTNTNGTVSGTASGAVGYNGAVFSLSGLPLGAHKIKFTINNATATYIDAIDIITPIYSQKDKNISYQNTLPTGSCSLSDSRKINMSSNKVWTQSIGVASEPTYAFSTPTPIPNMSTTIKTNGNPVQINYSIALSSDGTNYCATRIHVDGIQVSYDKGTHPSANLSEVTCDTLILKLSPGVHKIDVFWFTFAGTMKAVLVNRSLTVIEL